MLRKVNCLESEELWQVDDFLSVDVLSDLIQISANRKKQLRCSLNENPKFSYSSFKYWQVLTESGDLTAAYMEICQKINQLNLVPPKLEIASTPPKSSQVFMKAFSKDSHYNLHTEDTSVFGELAYIIYLTDEKREDLIFPSELDEQKYINTSESKDWDSMKNYLIDKKEPVTYCSITRSIKPVINRCVIFKTGLAHKVLPYEASKMGRYCLTGFPFAHIQ